QRDTGQPRRYFDEDRLRELSESIKAQGVLQPLLVRKEGSGYRLIAGERRWRAAQLAGLHEVPAIVREASDAQAFEQALVEELQRLLGTKVRLIDKGQGKGTLEIDYFSYEDLERLLVLLRKE